MGNTETTHTSHAAGVDGTIEDVPYETTNVASDGHDGNGGNDGHDGHGGNDGHDDGVAQDVPPQDHVDSVDDETPPVQGPAVAASGKRKRVSKWTSIENTTFDQSLDRQGDVFVLKMRTPLYILSPTVRLQTALFDDDEELQAYATFKMKSTHLSAFRELEETLLDATKKNKESWFGSDVTDEFLETSFKRFVDPDSKTLTVKIDEGLGGKVSVGTGTRVRVVLSCPHAIFTRTQFGIPWTVTVIRSIENTEDMYLFDPEEDARHAGVSKDLLSHLAQERCDDEMLAETL